jgi:hypothetical protein
MKNKNVLLIMVAALTLGGAGLYFMAQQNVEPRDLQASLTFTDEDIASVFKPERLSPVIDRARERMSQRTFGAQIDSGQYSGVYNGIGFNAFEDEQNGVEVPVSALCDGIVLEKRMGVGYGGIIVQECTLDQKPVKVLYAHLDLQSVLAKVGDQLLPGAYLANLGDHESSENAGAPKQLHFAIYAGDKPRADIRAYVTEEELSNWLNPTDYLPDLQ